MILFTIYAEVTQANKRMKILPLSLWTCEHVPYNWNILWPASENNLAVGGRNLYITLYACESTDHCWLSIGVYELQVLYTAYSKFIFFKKFWQLLEFVGSETVSGLNPLFVDRHGGTTLEVPLKVCSGFRSKLSLILYAKKVRVL